jgi:RimJ/RimL family protein N-acetyltransferase
MPFMHKEIDEVSSIYTMTTPNIASLDSSGFDEFLIYVNDHLSENGNAETGYFQPLSKNTSIFPVDRAVAFREGLEAQVGTKGWRRAWVARSRDGEIVGHIDLRAYPENFSQHRCLLGMGVHRCHRRAGLGLAMIRHVQQWALDIAKLEWIDLQVLSENKSAIALYQPAGFSKAGEVEKMFKIDGRYFSYTTMTLPLNEAR